MTEGDATFGQIIGGDRHGHPVSQHHADAETPQLTCQVRVYLGTRIRLDQESSTWIDFLDDTINFKQVVTCHSNLKGLPC